MQPSSQRNRNLEVSLKVQNTLSSAITFTVLYVCCYTDTVVVEICFCVYRSTESVYEYYSCIRTRPRCRHKDKPAFFLLYIQYTVLLYMVVFLL